MPDATLADFEALAGKVAVGDYPILPQPTWGQDAAMVAFFIDGLRAELLVKSDRIRELEERVVELADDVRDLQAVAAAARFCLERGQIMNNGDRVADALAALGEVTPDVE